MQKHYPASHHEDKFNCIHCNVYAKQHWQYFYAQQENGFSHHSKLEFCICEHCGQWSYWYEKRMIIPTDVSVPPAHVEMPEACVVDYDEARTIYAASPRAACALLRLALQKLLAELGENGKNINDDIQSLVAKGLPVLVQQALDFCRVVGNNAVHPGEIQINDTPEIGVSLFEMLNFIVEERIARPKQIQALYSGLPEGARKAIDARDKPKS
jgi:hypothetical protein